MSTECSAENIPSGCKQTEVGVIPEDWEVKSIVEIAPLQRGFDLPTSQLEEGPYPVVYSNGVMNTHKSAMVRGPGVITGRSGTLGKVHYVETDYWPHNTSLWVTRFNGNNPLFTFYLYTSIGFERFSSGSGVPTLNRNDAHAFRVQIPSSIDEQKFIAEALYDADSFIESLEHLIAKKRQIKQGAMQELLTGKRRLAGFTTKAGYKHTEVGEIPEDWICVESAGLVSYFGGNAFKSEDSTTSGVRWLKIANVGKRKIEWADTSFLPHSFINNFKAYLLQTGDVVMALTRPILDGELKISRITSRDVPCLLNQRVAKVIVQSNADLGFIYYILQTPHFVDSMNEAMAGTDPPNIGSKALGKILIPIPSTVLEQATIASILSDMDSEITLLEEKLAKARQIKQGMMQELLTGRIRLI